MCMQNDIKNKWSIFALLSWLYTYICILRKYIVLVFCFPRICLSFFHSSVCLAGLHLILFKWYIVVISMVHHSPVDGHSACFWFWFLHYRQWCNRSLCTGACFSGRFQGTKLLGERVAFLLHFLFYTRWHHWNSCD